MTHRTHSSSPLTYRDSGCFHALSHWPFPGSQMQGSSRLLPGLMHPLHPAEGETQTLAIFCQCRCSPLTCSPFPATVQPTACMSLSPQDGTFGKASVSVDCSSVVSNTTSGLITPHPGAWLAGSTGARWKKDSYQKETAGTGAQSAWCADSLVSQFSG